MIPESDPKIDLLNNQLLEIKEEVERLSKDKSELQTQLKEISDKRSELFITFFDSVSNEV